MFAGYQTLPLRLAESLSKHAAHDPNAVGAVSRLLLGGPHGVDLRHGELDQHLPPEGRPKMDPHRVVVVIQGRILHAARKDLGQPPIQESADGQSLIRHRHPSVELAANIADLRQNLRFRPARDLLPYALTVRPVTCRDGATPPVTIPVRRVFASCSSLSTAHAAPSRSETNALDVDLGAEADHMQCIQPKNPRPGMRPGYCKGKAHRRLERGVRRLQVLSAGFASRWRPRVGGR
jgi:hypothetical protein